MVSISPRKSAINILTSPEPANFVAWFRNTVDLDSDNLDARKPIKFFGSSSMFTNVVKDDISSLFFYGCFDWHSLIWRAESEFSVCERVRQSDERERVCERGMRERDERDER
jgi:hypothetical protein